jgi:hypothetical protein
MEQLQMFVTGHRADTNALGSRVHDIMDQRLTGTLNNAAVTSLSGGAALIFNTFGQEQCQRCVLPSKDPRKVNQEEQTE